MERDIFKKMAIREGVLELKPNMGKISLLYTNIASKWNTMISWERQVL